MAVINSSYSETFAAATDGARWLKAVVVSRGERGPLKAKPNGSTSIPRFPRTSAYLPILIETILRSGCLPPDRPAIRKARCICTTTCLTIRSVRETNQGVKRNDITVSVPKLFFGYATGTNFCFRLLSEARPPCLLNVRRRKRCWKLSERYRPTILTTVPTMINGMLNAEAENHDLCSFRFCYSRARRCRWNFMIARRNLRGPKFAMESARQRCSTSTSLTVLGM